MTLDFSHWTYGEGEMSENSGQTAELMREVRLGLVCYGGVSLAIYMHGVTKELYKLVRAARAFERAYDETGGQVPADENPDKWLAGAPGASGAAAAAGCDSER